MKPLEMQLNQIDRIIDKLLSKGERYKTRLYNRVVDRRNQILAAWYDERESPERCENELMEAYKYAL